MSLSMYVNRYIRCFESCRWSVALVTQASAEACAWRINEPNFRIFLSISEGIARQLVAVSCALGSLYSARNGCRLRLVKIHPAVGMAPARGTTTAQPTSPNACLG